MSCDHIELTCTCHVGSRDLQKNFIHIILRLITLYCINLIFLGNMNTETTLCEALASGLRLSICDPTKRDEVFVEMFSSMLGKEESPVYYISKTSQEYLINLELFLPFVKYSIKTYDSALLHDIPHWHMEEGKKEMICYKNSLIIMKHFQSKLQDKCDYQESGNVRFDVFHDSSLRTR